MLDNEYKVTILFEGNGENEISKMEFYIEADSFEEAVKNARNELGI